MTSIVPGSPPPGDNVVRYDTDYSKFSLDEIFAMVDGTDQISYAQMDNWTTASQLFLDLAVNLEKAVTTLHDHWPAIPGSASEVFMGKLTGLVTALKSDAWSAYWVGSSLNNVVERLNDTSSKVIDVYYKYQNLLITDPVPADAVDDSLIGPIGNIDMGQPTNGDPNWRVNLPNQARDIMSDSDHALAITISYMPTVQKYAPDFSDVGGTLPPVRAYPGGSRMPGNMHTLPRQPGGPGPIQPVPVDPNSGTTLAGGVLDGPGAGGGTGGPGSPVPGGGYGGPGYTPGGISLLPGPNPINGVIGQAPGGYEPTTAAASRLTGPGAAADEVPLGRTGALGTGTGAMGTGMMPGGMAGRGAGAGGRTRPGGRPGLWSSKRRKKSDPNDPWSVAHGVPAILEPAEPTEHDPGPGVIGLDR
jgi:hypothetical protein